MRNNGIMIICGNSIEELERDLQLMKEAMHCGMRCGIGGSSLEDIECGLKVAKNFANMIEDEEEGYFEEDEEEEDYFEDYDEKVIFEKYFKSRDF